MQIIVNGHVVHNAPDLKGYKVDLTRPVLRLNIDPKNQSASETEGRYDSNEITPRHKNALIPVAAMEGDEGKVIRFKSQPSTLPEIDEEANLKKRNARHEYLKWNNSMIDRIEPIANTLDFTGQYEYFADFKIRQHAELRELDPPAFRGCLSLDKTIEEIRSGYSPSLGDFTMDDWFSYMGENWKDWITENGLSENWNSTATRDYVYEQAKLRGLL